VYFGGVFEAGTTVDEYTVSLLFDNGFATKVTHNDTNSVEEVTVAMNYIFEENLDKPGQSRVTLQKRKWGSLTLVNQGTAQQRYYRAKRSLDFNKFTVDFLSQFTESEMRDEKGNLVLPANFKYSVQINNYSYKYDNSRLWMYYSIQSLTTKRIFDPANNRIVYGDSNYTVYSWVPTITAGGVDIPLTVNYMTDDACTPTLFDCTKKGFAYDTIGFGFETNSNSIYWDPTFNAIMKTKTLK